MTANRKQWGFWRYDPKALTDAAQVLNLIVSLAGYPWVSTEDLGWLVRAIDDLLDLQTNACGFGLNCRFDPWMLLKGVTP